jgi:hypothetical protein
MNKHSLKLAVLCGALLAATLARPAFADDQVRQDGNCLAVLYSNAARTCIEITDSGVTGRVWCHTARLSVDGPHTVPNSIINPGGTGNITVNSIFCNGDGSHTTLCGEAFNACVGGKFHIGAFSRPLNPLIIRRFNLQAASSNTFPGNSSLNRPFVQVGGSIIFLKANQVADDCIGANGFPVPAYDLDHQDLGSGVKPLPLGILVQLITENLPVKGTPANEFLPSDGTVPTVSRCLGVRTTFQHRVGTCKIWKVRKYFNTCSSVQVLTQVKEFEDVCDPALMGQQFSPAGAILSAVAQTLPTLHQKLITLSSMGNTGANPINANPKFFQPSAAGSVCKLFDEEFFSCQIFTDTNPCFFTSSQVLRPAGSWLEVFLGFFPGGVKLQPFGSKLGGFEKLLTFCIDVE